MHEVSCTQVPSLTGRSYSSDLFHCYPPQAKPFVSDTPLLTPSFSTYFLILGNTSLSTTGCWLLLKGGSLSIPEAFFWPYKKVGKRLFAGACSYWVRGNGFNI